MICFPKLRRAKSKASRIGPLQSRVITSVQIRSLVNDDDCSWFDIDIVYGRTQEEEVGSKMKEWRRGKSELRRPRAVKPKAKVEREKREKRRRIRRSRRGRGE